MISSNHQLFASLDRVSQPLSNDRCQNILYKSVFEHFKELPKIAALLLSSKSFQNSSFGANFLINFVIDKDSISLFEFVLAPSSCFSLQFAPSLYIEQAKQVNRSISIFVEELVETKYFRLSLRSLHLDHVTDEVLLLFFSGCINSWPQLGELTVENRGQNDAALVNISKNAVHLRSVKLSRCSGITHVGLEQLSKLSGITSLSLCRCSEITDVGAHLLSELSGVTSLDLSGCNVGDTGVEHFSKFINMTALNLSGCRMITDTGLESISSLSGITSLNLFNCNLITDVGLEHLATLAGITSLDLSYCNKITNSGLELISKLDNITSLKLCGCTTITDAGLEHIAKLHNITSFDMSLCFSVTDAGLAHLSSLSLLTSLNLSWCYKITIAATTKLREELPKCKIDQ